MVIFRFVGGAPGSGGGGVEWGRVCPPPPHPACVRVRFVLVCVMLCDAGILLASYHNGG